MSDRAGILDHEEIDAIEETLAGGTTKLAALLRLKYPLSREMREHIAAMLAIDGNSAWCLELKRRSRGRPSMADTARKPPLLLPLTRARQALIVEMLDESRDTGWILRPHRRKAGRRPATPLATGFNHARIGELVANLLGLGVSDDKEAIKVTAAALSIKLEEEAGANSTRFRERSARLARIRIARNLRSQRNAVDLVCALLGLERSVVHEAYKSYRDANARLIDRK